MEVTLSAELQAKLARIARERGIEPEALAQETIERTVNYDDWFLHKVDNGLAQVDRGETLSHDETGASRTTPEGARPAPLIQLW